MKVIELLPGMVLNGNVMIIQGPHPVFPELQLIVWRRRNGELFLEGLRPGHELPGKPSILGREPELRRALGLR